ncbi:unnamed protein product [Effrenium voratum]|nr:unnamed protein product [Effrenium voratum]
MAMNAFGPRLAPRLDESEAAPPISRRLPARKAALAGGRLQPSGSAPALRRRRGSSTSSLTLETPETPKVSASSTPDRRLAQVPSDGTGAFERARWAKKNVSLIDWKSAAARAVEDRASQKRQVPQSYDQDTRSHREEPSLFLSMQRQQRFLAARMVPPGYRLKVIFQVDSTLQLLPGERERMSPEVMLRICQELPELSPDAEQIARTDASPRSGRTVFIASLPEVSVLARTESSPSSKNARGVVSDGPEGSVLLPRVTETEFKSQVKRSPPFWQGFKRETFAMHREALRVDWLRCRLGHVVPESEIDDIKKALEPHYGWLMCLYRRVASSDVNGETGFGISQLQAGELMMNHSICDGSTTKVADIDRFFIAAKVTPQEMKKTLSVVNDKTLVRYEFLEFLLRLLGCKKEEEAEAGSVWCVSFASLVGSKEDE